MIAEARPMAFKKASRMMKGQVTVCKEDILRHGHGIRPGHYYSLEVQYSISTGDGEDSPI